MEDSSIDIQEDIKPFLCLNQETSKDGNVNGKQLNKKWKCYSCMHSFSSEKDFQRKTGSMEGAHALSPPESLKQEVSTKFYEIVYHGKTFGSASLPPFISSPPIKSPSSK